MNKSKTTLFSESTAEQVTKLAAVVARILVRFRAGFRRVAVVRSQIGPGQVTVDSRTLQANFAVATETCHAPRCGVYPSVDWIFIVFLSIFETKKEKRMAPARRTRFEFPWVRTGFTGFPIRNSNLFYKSKATLILFVFFETAFYWTRLGSENRVRGGFFFLHRLAVGSLCVGRGLPTVGEQLSIPF